VESKLEREPIASSSACIASGRPDCWSSLDVEFGSVTQQSISEFAMVKVFAKLPKSSTFAARYQYFAQRRAGNY
jgi:hypothetical protein